ncbi:MAG: sensor histidine kinase [Muribaculaceae bacterium]
MKTLLHKTSVRIIGVIAATFLLTAPLFYLITRYFYAEDMIDIIEAVERGEGVPSSFDLEQDIIAGVMIQYGLIFVVIALSMLIAMRFVLRNLWNPFENTLKAMERFKVSDSTLPTYQDGGIEEFRRLNNALSELMRRNAGVYREQKEFTENASHELQTPLAVMRSRLDLLLQRPLDKATLDCVSGLYDVSRRMERLNRDLLLLTKISNDQFAMGEIADVVAAIRNVCANLSPMGYDVRATMPESYVVMANNTLLESLVNNLVVNAVRSSGKADIKLEGHRLAVSNPSRDGQPLDSDRLLRRFASGASGNGLGLAIVKAICDFHGWHIGYDFEHGTHRFTVKMER